MAQLYHSLQDSIKAPLRHLLSEFPPRWFRYSWTSQGLSWMVSWSLCQRSNSVFIIKTGSCPEKCWSVLQLAGMGEEKMQSRHQFLLRKLHRCTKSKLVFSELLILSFTSVKPDVSFFQQHIFFYSPRGLGFCLWNNKKKDWKIFLL